MNTPHDVMLLDPPAQPDGTTAETNIALGRAIERLQQPCSGGTDEARERAWRKACSTNDINPVYCALVVRYMFDAAYDAARSEYERKVAELEQREAGLQQQANRAFDRAEKAEARVRDLEVSRAGVVREYGDAKVEFEAALATEREMVSKLRHIISVVIGYDPDRELKDLAEREGDVHASWCKNVGPVGDCDQCNGPSTAAPPWPVQALSATPPAEVPAYEYKWSTVRGRLVAEQVPSTPPTPPHDSGCASLRLEFRQPCNCTRRTTPAPEGCK